MPSDDTKNGPGGGSEDPWAGIDADATPGEGESFEFPDFDLTAKDPSDEPAAPTPAPANPDAGGVPSFDALSLGARDGVFTDEAGWDPAPPTTAPTASEPVDPPLAVFPPFDADPRAAEQAEPSEDAAPSLFGQAADETDVFAGQFPEGAVAAAGAEAGDVDAMEFLEDQAEPAAEAPGESTIQIGTGQSGILPFEDWAESSEATVTDASAEPSTSESPFGEPSFEDLGFDAPAEEAPVAAAEATLADDAFADDALADAALATDALADDALAEAVVPEAALAEDPLFGGVESDESSGFPVGEVAAAAGAAGAAAAVAGATEVKKAKPVRKVVKRRSGGGGGIAAALSVLLGGALSIPVVIGLLFWVFKKDPFHIAGKIPASMSFLLPSEFQVAARGKKLPGIPKGDTLLASRSLDELVPNQPPASDKVSPPSTDPAADLLADESAASKEPSPTKPASPESKPSDPAADLFAEDEAGPKTPKKEEPEPPPPLDTSALDEAVANADAMTTDLLAADESDPAFKRMLRDWYVAVAKLGEETVTLEQKASETGQAFDARSAAVERTVGRILGSERTSGQFAKLSRMWLKARGRSSDGVVLPAVMVSSRKVGGWWSSRVRVSEDPEVPEVLVLSRSQPDASEGDAAVVLGLVFEPGVVWASAFGRFEPVSAEDDPTEEEPADEPAEDEDKPADDEEEPAKDKPEEEEESEDEPSEDESEEDESEEDEPEKEEDDPEEDDPEEKESDAEDESAEDESAEDESAEEESEEASEDEESKDEAAEEKPAAGKPSSRDDDLFPPE